MLTCISVLAPFSASTIHCNPEQLQQQQPADHSRHTPHPPLQDKRPEWALLREAQGRQRARVGIFAGAEILVVVGFSSIFLAHHAVEDIRYTLDFSHFAIYSTINNQIENKKKCAIYSRINKQIENKNNKLVAYGAILKPKTDYANMLKKRKNIRNFLI